jgi:peptide subunit release factor 1 (eRF1)
LDAATKPGLNWNLNTGLKQKLVERFTLDPAGTSPEEVRRIAEEILNRKRLQEQQRLVREVIGQASRNATGAVGLKHVLTALERQEVQTLILSPDFHAEAVECTNCRRLDARMVKTCAACGQETRQLNDISGALIDSALRNGADIEFIASDADLEKAGRVGALLRFRADQNTAEKVAV